MSNSKSTPPHILKPNQLPFQKCIKLGVICWNHGGKHYYVKVGRISTLSHNLTILRGSSLLAIDTFYDGNWLHFSNHEVSFPYWSNNIILTRGARRKLTIYYIFYRCKNKATAYTLQNNTVSSYISSFKFNCSF